MAGLDVKEGDADMGARAFHWRQETGVTPAARMRRVEVSVFLRETIRRWRNDRIRRADGNADSTVGITGSQADRSPDRSQDADGASR